MINRQHNDIFLRFAEAAGLDPEEMSPRDNLYLERLVRLTVSGYDAPVDESDIIAALQKARAEGKRVRVVPDRDFWKNGSRFMQLDGWTYHIELYKPHFRQDVIFEKNKRTDKIYWVTWPISCGDHLFSFDREKIYNLFADYPHNLSPEEKAIFDAENPYWVNFFRDRQPNNKNK